MTGGNGSDCNGHGTHVAGTVGGGSGYGVAPEVTLASARVLDCEGSGSVSGIIYALDWIAGNARRPAVANMSLGGTASASLDDAVTRLISLGISTVVAAGNETADACNVSPARVPNALTIAATDKSDARASFSNYGSCVDLFAPGAGIVSAYHTSSTALAQMSGTSMAAPHVAGRAALLLGVDPSLDSAAVNEAVVSTATPTSITNALGSPNLVLFVGTATATAPSGSEGVTINGTSGNDVVDAKNTVAGQPLPTSGPDTIHGLAGNDSLAALAGNDTVNGGDGTDMLTGGPGDDRIDGGAGIDTASYGSAPAGVTVNLKVTSGQNTGGAGTDTLQNVERVSGSNYADVLTGSSGANWLGGGNGNDTVHGGLGDDTVRGGPEDDLVNGGGGNDLLDGGPGRDQFRFDSPLDASKNVDRIADFSVADDTIQLSRSIFTALGAKGTLPQSAFRIGTAAQDADDRIIYDSATGNLYYDADGNGGAAQILFSRVSAGLALTNADFTVIN